MGAVEESEAREGEQPGRVSPDEVMTLAGGSVRRVGCIVDVVHWSLSLDGLFVVGLVLVVDTHAPERAQPGDSSEVVGPSVLAGAPLSVLSSQTLDVLA